MSKPLYRILFAPNGANWIDDAKHNRRDCGKAVVEAREFSRLNPSAKVRVINARTKFEIFAAPKTQLLQAAQSSKGADQFIRKVQTTPGLLEELYAWENSTPENQKRFKNAGWFGIAAEFWNETNLPVMAISGENVAGERSASNPPQNLTRW